MKALVYQGPRQMSWTDWPGAEPGPGEALVAVRAVGVCGSDLHGYTGESGRRTPPMVMGHEATGQVLALGAEAPAEWLGRSVVLQPILFCGECDQCRAGYQNRCRSRRFLGANAAGAMAQRLVVPVRNLLPLAENVSALAGTLTEPLSVARHAVKQAGDLTGRTVLIAGSGPIGLLTLVAARENGARAVVMTDVIAARLEAARSLGAAAALDPTTPDWRDRLATVVGGPEVEVAFEAVGIQSTFQQALDSLRPGGTLIALGGWRTIELNLPSLVAREIDVRGSFNFTPDEFTESLQWLAEHRFDPAGLVTATRPMEEGAAVFDELARSRAEAIKVVLTA